MKYSFESIQRYSRFFDLRRRSCYDTQVKLNREEKRGGGGANFVSGWIRSRSSGNLAGAARRRRFLACLATKERPWGSATFFHQHFTVMLAH